MHVLAQVRAAAVAALTGLATTGTRVYTQDAYTWLPDQLPGLLVTTAGDPVMEVLEWPGPMRWDITLQVSAMARGLGSLTDVLDQITSEVQVALASMNAVNGAVVQVIPVSFLAPEFAGDGDQPVARRLMTFDVRGLYTEANEPDTLI